MDETSLERMLSLPNPGTGLVKPIKYFDPDKNYHKWPKYTDPLTQKINNIVNDHSYVPFDIISATKTKTDGKEKLTLKGEYKTFDDVNLKLTFEGTYGDPKNTHSVHKLHPEDAFSDYTLKAKLVGADPRQEKIFSMIKLHDEDLCFKEGELSHRYNWRHLSNAGLSEIKEISKIVGIYEHLHIKDVIKEVIDKKNKFEQELEELSFGDYELGVKINESFIYDAKDKFEFKSVIEMQAIKTHNLKPEYSTSIIHNIRIGCPKVIDPTIKLDWSRLNNQFNSQFGMGVPNSCIDFMLSAFGFHHRNDYDIVEDADQDTFDIAVLDAREEIIRKDASYEPLYLTRFEGNMCLEDTSYGKPEERILRFRSKKEYMVFERMMILESSTNDINVLIEDKKVQERLNKNPNLKRRIMTFYEEYKKDPENACSNFCKKDPAYVRGSALYDQREEELRDQRNKEKAD